SIYRQGLRLRRIAAPAGRGRHCPWPGRGPISGAMSALPPPIADTTAAADGRRTLIGLSRDELRAEIAALGEPDFRARQLWHWIYHHGARSFDAMTTLSKGFRAKLAERFTLDRPAAARALVSSDGTRKWLLRFA